MKQLGLSLTELAAIFEFLFPCDEHVVNRLTPSVGIHGTAVRQ